MSMPVRLISKITHLPPEPKVKHFRGLPPELTGGSDQREVMQTAALVTIEEKPDGVFLFRFTADGQIVGDTWHMTVDEAKQQAKFEYNDALTAWIPVPAEVEDSISFGSKPN